MFSSQQKVTLCLHVEHSRFNSYTQEICIDNAVVGISDPEDSQPVVPVPEMPVVVGNTSTPPAIMETTTALTTTPKAPVTQLVGSLQTSAQTYPSQIVTYYSKYVDKLSDVSSDMNISGSLSIKYGEISGGGSGSFVDVETFQNSDMNFLISVKVIHNICLFAGTPPCSDDSLSRFRS